jgi:hypothetical protein
MPTLRNLAFGAIAASAVAFVTVAYAGEAGVTPKHVQTSHSWLPRDHFKIETGRVEIGAGEARGKTSETKPHLPRNSDARLWIPGVGCAGTAVAFYAAAPRGVQACLAAATGPAARPDWVAVAIAAVAGRRAALAEHPLTS